MSAAVQMTYAQAAALALSQAMARDPNVIALGEDLGRGGVFGQYRDADGEPLVRRFGPDRIIDTPISESTIVGAAVGMAPLTKWWTRPPRTATCSAARAACRW